MPKLKFRMITLTRKGILRAIGAAAIIVLAIIGARPSVEAVFSQSSDERKLPIYSVETEEAKVAISFDAAWGADDTDELLRILRENDVKTTFFICGYWIDKYPEEVKKIYEEGHEIGNHSNTHPHGNELTLEKNKEEIQAAHDKVRELIGVDMILYRPPFGEYNNTVLQAVEELNYYAIQWDVDTLETKIEALFCYANAIFSRASF